MARYILIDDASGYVWGDTGDLNGPARDETVVDAARRLDESLNEVGRTYDDHGPSFIPASNEGAYHVYRADIDGSEAVPVVEDGQDQETIEMVYGTCRKVAVVTFTDAPRE
jgi:hypothetical protein